MKQITIDTGSTTGLGAFGVFQKEGLQPGDTLRIVKRPSLSPDSWAVLLLLVMQAANYFLKRKNTTAPPAADDLMNEVARSGKGLADLQAELKAEHNVQLIVIDYLQHVASSTEREKQTQAPFALRLRQAT